MTEFSELKGLMLTSITVGDTSYEDKITFTTDGGVEYKMVHVQDCCENVSIDDICGDLEDLLNTPILLAEEVTSDTNPEGVEPEYQDCFTWTFYKLSTIKGSVTIRWYGESNGYYSESVDFVKEGDYYFDRS